MATRNPELEARIMAFAHERKAFRQAQFCRLHGLQQYVVSRATRRLEADGLLKRGPHGVYGIPGHENTEIAWGIKDNKTPEIVALLKERGRTLRELAEAVGLTLDQTYDRLDGLRLRGAVHCEYRTYYPGRGKLKVASTPAIDSLQDWLKKCDRPVHIKQIYAAGWNEITVRRAKHRGAVRTVSKGMYVSA